MRNRITAFITAFALMALSSGAQALVLKSGQVLGSDGNVYDGASPEQQANMIANSKREDFFGNKNTSGVINNNVFIIVEDKTVFVPVSLIIGKTKEDTKQIITDFVVDKLTKDIQAFHSGDVGQDGWTAEDAAQAAVENIEELDIANDPVIAQLAADAAATAAVDVEAAIALVETTVAIALSDGPNSQLEAAFEAANEAAHEARCPDGPESGEGC